MTPLRSQGRDWPHTWTSSAELGAYKRFKRAAKKGVDATAEWLQTDALQNPPIKWRHVTRCTNRRLLQHERTVLSISASLKPGGRAVVVIGDGVSEPFFGVGPSCPVNLMAPWQETVNALEATLDILFAADVQVSPGHV